VPWGLLSGQNEATGTCARELYKSSRHELAATSLRIEQRAYLPRISDGAETNRHDPLAFADKRLT
jgi:hypothetical protein